MIDRNTGRQPPDRHAWDQRVLHIIKRGYGDTLSPGVRYNVYSFDFGSFVNIEDGFNKPMVVSEFEDRFGQEVNRCAVFADDRVIPRVVIDIDQANP